MTPLNIVLMILTISSVVIIVYMLPHCFNLFERVGIAAAITSVYWILSAYLGLAVSGAVPIVLIVALQFLATTGTLAVSSYKFGFTGKNIAASINHHRVKPSLPSIAYFMYLTLFALIPFAPILPTSTDSIWTQIFTDNVRWLYLRQTEMLSIIGPLTIVLLLLFSVFSLAFYTEKNRLVLFLVTASFVAFLVLFPIRLLGRPWGIDTYDIGYFLFADTEGRFGLAAMDYAAFLQILNVLVLKGVVGFDVTQTLTLGVPFLNLQLFLGIWIVFSEHEMDSPLIRSLILLVSTGPILLQTARIGTSLVLGVYYMLMAIWFLQRYRRARVTTQCSSSRKPLLIASVLFAAMTGVHHVTALSLIVLLLLYPVVESLHGSESLGKIHYAMIGGVYAFLELGQFFQTRAAPMLETLGVSNAILMPLFEISISGTMFVFRPIFPIMIFGAAVFFSCVSKWVGRHMTELATYRIAFVYKILAYLTLLVGLIAVGIMVLGPHSISGIDLLQAYSLEIVLFYNMYLIFFLLIPFLMIRNESYRGLVFTLYAFSHAVVLVPQILFHIIDGGLVYRLVLSIPVFLGFLRIESISCLGTTRNSAVLMVAVSIISFLGFLGSLLVACVVFVG